MFWVYIKAQIFAAVLQLFLYVPDLTCTNKNFLWEQGLGGWSYQD